MYSAEFGCRNCARFSTCELHIAGMLWCLDWKGAEPPAAEIKMNAPEPEKSDL